VMRATPELVRLRSRPTTRRIIGVSGAGRGRAGR
jgi:hypothetical protein